MKYTLPKMLAAVVVVLLVWTLTKISNANSQKEAEPVASFWLERQQVQTCSDKEILLIDQKGAQAHLVKGEGWPDCSAFPPGAVLDFQLTRGERTKLLKWQKTAWWR